MRGFVRLTLIVIFMNLGQTRIKTSAYGLFLTINIEDFPPYESSGGIISSGVYFLFLVPLQWEWGGASQLVFKEVFCCVHGFQVRREYAASCVELTPLVSFHTISATNLPFLNGHVSVFWLAATGSRTMLCVRVLKVLNCRIKGWKNISNLYGCKNVSDHSDIIYNNLLFLLMFFWQWWLLLMLATDLPSGFSYCFSISLQHKINYSLE